MHFRSKLRNMSDSRKFRRKNTVNCFKVPTLPPFKKICYFFKTEKHLLIFYCKNKCTDKFNVFAIKSALGNMSESREF